MALWTPIPHRLGDVEAAVTKNAAAVLVTTAVTFFLAEMGDEVQIVSIALAARFHAFVGVVASTTFGMMLANVPVTHLGNRFGRYADERGRNYASSEVPTWRSRPRSGKWPFSSLSPPR
jgi:putative Ca2+/H+ antiporter (TMEM165/GDT1 family)